MKRTKQDILKIVQNEDIEFIRLQFTDIYGNLKNMAVTASQLEKVLNNRSIFDGAAIAGFSGSEKSELVLYPDLDTFNIFPWRPQHGKVARFICDVYKLNGKPYECDSRFILKKVLKEASEMGLSVDVGPECEFFLFDCDENGDPTINTKEQGGFFDVGPIDKGENARRDLVITLEDMDFEVRASYHESEPSQHEIDFKNADALTTADNVMTFRMAVRTVARRHGLHATFMPKPRTDFNGSGMTLNLSLYNEMGKNVFTCKEDRHGLSEIAYSFIAGILKHQDALTAICNPIINSYKRFASDKNIPIYKGWSSHSRSMTIRVPLNTDVTTVSLRTPDSAANPYLALAVCIASGLDGIKNKLTIPSDKNEKLPMSLYNAIQALKADALVKKCFGKRTNWKIYKCKNERMGRIQKASNRMGVR